MDLSQLTTESREALNAAQSLAGQLGQEEVQSLHLLGALVDDGEGTASVLLEEAGVSLRAVRRQVMRRLALVGGVPGHERFIGQELTNILDRASKLTIRMGDAFLSTQHLLLTLATTSVSGAGSLLREMGLREHSLRAAMVNLRDRQRMPAAIPEGALLSSSRSTLAHERATHLTVDSLMQHLETQLRATEVLLASRGLSLEVDLPALAFLTRAGSEGNAGASPLRRAIRNFVLLPLSEMLIAGQVPAGSCIRLSANDAGLKISTGPGKAPASACVG